MDRFKLITDFPTEILEKIFEHFDDTTATLAGGVCKRFNDVLNHTVHRKYNGSSQKKWYKMEIFDCSMENDRHEILQHHPFILKRVSAIQLSFHTELNDQPHWIHQVLGTIGHNIKMIRLKNAKIDEIDTSLNFYNILSKTPNMSYLYVDSIYPTSRNWCHQRYEKLTHLEMRLRTLVFDYSKLKPFVRNNSQLKNVNLQITDFRVLYAFHKSKIEYLHCNLWPTYGKDIFVNIRHIEMTNLKKLSLNLPNYALNKCIKKVVAQCLNLTDLRLLYFDNARDILTDESMDILCKFRSMEKFEPFLYISLQNIVRLIAALPTLVSISLQCKTFTTDDYKVLLKEANKHKNLRHIHFQLHELYEESLLRWLMENINNQVQLDYSWCKTLSITKGKVRYNGVTIMSSDGSPIEYAKMTPDWLQKVQFSSDQCYEFFSNLPIPIIQACFDVKKDSVLHLSDASNEAVVRRKGKYITTAKTTLSANNEKSVDHLNWLEKYCCRLEQLDIYIEGNHPHLPSWTFSELKFLRVHCRQSQPSLDLLLFASLKCLKLNCFKLVGRRPIMLANIQIVRDIDLFDNLVTLQIFHFNESTDQLLEQFNQNVQNNLRNLTLANRRVEGSRYKMNNKTITATSRFTNLFQLKLILPGINDTNTKYLFENCTKLSELSFECNFLSARHNILNSFNSYHMFHDIKANCISLTRLQLVWYNHMMDPYRVIGIKKTFPNVVVKIMQLNEDMRTTAEQIVPKSYSDGLEQLLDEFVNN